MRSELKYKSSSEQGFTLLELVIALAILAVGILAVTQVFFSASELSLTTETRERANRLINSEVEKLMTIEWSELSMSNAAGLPTTFEGEPVVFSTNSRVSAGPDVVMHDGSNFEVTRWVTEKQDLSGRPFRHIVVIARATAPGPGFDLVSRTDSARYGGYGLEMISNPPPPTGIPDPPSLVAVTLPAFVNPASAVVVSWVRPAVEPQFFDVAVSSNNGASWVRIAENISPALDRWQIKGLSANHTYRIGVRSRNGATASPYSETVHTTLASTPLLCDIGAIGISPSETVISPPEILSENVVVEVGTNSGCAALNLEVHGGPVLLTLPMTQDNTVFRSQVSAGTGPFQVGIYQVRIVDPISGVTYGVSSFAVVG